MAQQSEITLARPIVWKDEGSGKENKINVLKLRTVTVSDLAHVVIGNAPNGHYAEVIALCSENVPADEVRCCSAKNSGLFTKLVVGQFLGSDKGVKVHSMFSDEHVDLFVPIKLNKTSGNDTDQVEVTRLEMREPALDEVGFIPSEQVTVGHYLELVANCVSNVPEDAVRKCDAENALPLIAWAANFIGAGPMDGAT